MQLCALLAALTLTFGLQATFAQNVPGAPSTQSPSRKSHHRKGSPAHAAVPAPVQEQPPAPVVPEAPKWPLNDPPAPPSVLWDSKGLQIQATNSSLRQILDEVASTTGAKVEGLQADERVFGDYGPGPARDVISQILHGSSYNVLMLGDEGQGTPREIILSERTKTGGAQPAANSQGFNRQAVQPDDEVEQPEPEEPNQMPINRPPNIQPMNQPGVPMTPQQRMLELQRQQMQMQQQQQQNQNQQIPPQPPQD